MICQHRKPRRALVLTVLALSGALVPGAAQAQLQDLTSAGALLSHDACTSVLTVAAGGENAVVFRAHPSAITPTSAGVVVQGTLWVENGPQSLPLSNVTAQFVGNASTLQFSSVTGVTDQPRIPFGAFQGIDEALTSRMRVSFTLARGQAESLANALPLAPTRNYLLFTPDMTNVQVAPKASYKIGSLVIQTNTNPLHMLIDPVAPTMWGIFDLPDLPKMGPVGSVALGLSALSSLPYAPLNAVTGLNPFLSSFNGQLFLYVKAKPAKFVEFNGNTVMSWDVGNTGTPIGGGEAYKLGVNGTVTLQPPMLQKLGLTMTLGKASAVVQEVNGRFGVDVAGLMDPQSMALTGTPVSLTWRDKAKVAMHFDSADISTAYLRADGQFTMNTSALSANIPGQPRLDPPMMTGYLRADRTGFALAGTMDRSLIAGLPVEGASTTTASFSESTNDFSFTQTITNGSRVSGLPIESGTITVNNQGANATLVYPLKVGRLTLTGTASSSGVVLTGTVRVSVPIIAPYRLVEVVEDAGLCGVNTVANGAKCGWETVTDIDRCGFTWASCIGSCLTFDCKCKKAKTCTTAKSCKVAKACNRVTEEASHGYGTLSGTASFTLNGSAGSSLQGSVDVRICEVPSRCTSGGFNSRIDLKDPNHPKICVGGLAGMIGPEVCADL